MRAALRAVLALFTASAALVAQTGKLTYPVPPKSDTVDDYHGIKVPDPYRTLEDADAPATQKFVEQENELTLSWLSKIPGREAIRSRLTSVWNYEKYISLYKAGPHYFQHYNSGLQNQAELYVLDSLNGTPRVCSIPTLTARMGLPPSRAKPSVGTASCWHTRSRKPARIGTNGGSAM